MKFLVIDTSTEGTTVAVFEDKKSLKTVYDADNTKQNEHLPLMVRDIMKDLSLAFADIDKILVTKGPGSFTGIRIGLAFARGLAMASDMEVVGIDNFDALRGNYSFDGEVLTAIDSKKGDWFFKIPDGIASAGGADAAKKLVLGMKNPKIVGYHTGNLGELTGISDVFETRVTAESIVNAYFSLSDKADRFPAPLYIRPADVTIKK